MNVAAEYQAKRLLLGRVRRSVATGMNLPARKSVASIFKDMVALYPVGSRVSATFYKSVLDDAPMTVEGVVHYSANFQEDEPLFEISHSDGELILVRGSALSPLD